MAAPGVGQVNNLIVPHTDRTIAKENVKILASQAALHLFPNRAATSIVLGLHGFIADYKISKTVHQSLGQAATALTHPMKRYAFQIPGILVCLFSIHTIGEGVAQRMEKGEKFSPTSVEFFGPVLDAFLAASAMVSILPAMERCTEIAKRSWTGLKKCYQNRSASLWDRVKAGSIYTGNFLMDFGQTVFGVYKVRNLPAIMMDVAFFVADLARLKSKT